MSFLEKLLDDVKVEWRDFGAISKIQRGASPRPIAKFITDDENGVPWIKIGDTIPNSKYVYKTKQKITTEGAKKSRLLKKGDLIMSNSMSFGRPYILSIDGAIHDGWASISDFGDILNTDYLYHYLASDIVQDYWLSKVNSSSVSNLNADIIKSLKIPIPCPDNPAKSFKIQKEIVRILDAFTELTTELTTKLTEELTARKKQYSYYLEQLLTYDESEVEWKKLSEIVLKTSNIKWGDTNKVYRYIDLASVCREKNIITETTEINRGNAPSRAKKIVLQDDVIFATTRPTQLRLCLITEEYSDEIASTGYCVLRANTKVVLPKWIYFWITSNKFKNYAEDNQSGTAYPAISDSKVKNFSIPVPTPEEQERIVNILDKFDILTTSISEGLPKEIELRKKQYEYYREKLLTFPKEGIIT